MDVETIQLGKDFRAEISRAVGQCHALLAVIGDFWLHAQDQSSRPRLEDANDFVRLEIETALSRGVTVVPVLVGKANMPTVEQLPETLKKLAFCHGIAVRSDPHFNGDVDYLLRHLNAVPEIGEDEVSIYEYLTKHVKWDAMDRDRKATLKVVLLMLLGCVEGHEINTNKLAHLMTIVSGGAVGFDLPGGEEE
jgi:hypothetical protein